MEILLLIIVVVVVVFYGFIRQTYQIKSGVSQTQFIKILREHFGSKYDIYTTAVFGADFIIKKSALEGVACKLKNKKGKTEFIFWPEAPGYWARYFFSLIAIFFKGKDIMNDVKEFLDNSPELQATQVKTD